MKNKREREREKERKREREREMLRSQYFSQQILSDKLLLIGKKVISVVSSN